MKYVNRLSIILFSLLLVFCAMCLALIIGVGAQGGGTNDLFVELTGQATLANLPQSPSVIKSRRIGVNPSALEKDRVILEITPGVRITAIQHHREVRLNGDFIWTGEVEGEPLSRVTFALRNGVLAGWISRPLKNELYELIPDSSGNYLLAQINEGELPVCGMRQPRSYDRKSSGWSCGRRNSYGGIAHSHRPVSGIYPGVA